jgi:hypothetical protein
VTGSQVARTHAGVVHQPEEHLEEEKALALVLEAEGTPGVPGGGGVTAIPTQPHSPEAANVNFKLKHHCQWHLRPS